jgi:ectoine hydroxylase-related dioxygenase (phytanoyl-CoA dioxygenase family)
MSSEAVFNASDPDFSAWQEYFNTNGYIVIHDCLSADIVRKLRIDLAAAGKPSASARVSAAGARAPDPRRHVVHKCFFENSATTVQLVGDSVLASFAQWLIRGGPEPRESKSFGSDSLQMHLIHNNAFVVPPGGRGQAPGWHVDDPLQQVEVPEGKTLPVWVKLPVLVVTAMCWLSDCVTPAHGPTHVVPGSHRFGRAVDPRFADTRAIPACGKAGTVVLVNSQTWHRGAANESSVPRETVQLTFARRIVGHKFGTIMNYRMPDHVVRAIAKDERQKKKMGFLGGGAYS